MNVINLHDIQISDMELFLKVAEYRSFTKAGEKLFMSQSWVSKRINLIENELGLTLFIRNKREIVLTPAGRVLQQRFQRIVDSIIDALQEAHAAQSGVSGNLKLGFLEWGTVVFLNQLERFISDNPQIGVEIYRRQFRDLRSDISNDRLDLIFTMSYDCNQFPEDQYNIMQVQRVPMMAYLNKKHPLASKPFLTPDDLRAEPILMVDPISSSGYANHVSGIFERSGIRPIIAQYANDGGAHIGSILINKGILLASKFFLDNSWQEAIARVPVKDEYIYVNAVWQRTNPNPVLMKYVEDILSEIGRESGAAEYINE